MPVPVALEFAPTALVAAHQALLDTLETGAGDPTLVILDEDDATLATSVISAGAVNGTTGQLTLTVSSVVASVSGIAAYGEIRDAGGVKQIAMPAQAGGVAVSGKLVINTLTIIAGQPVNLASLTVG